MEERKNLKLKLAPKEVCVGRGATLIYILLEQALYHSLACFIFPGSLIGINQKTARSERNERKRRFDIKSSPSK